MAKHMYLVQSGKFAPLNFFYENHGDGALRDLGKLIRFSYMGSAEFEFGGVPASIRRIVEGKYEIKKSKFSSVRGVPLWIVSSNNTPFEEAEKMIDSYLEDCDPHKIRCYRLKEYICLENYIIPWYAEHDYGIEYRYDTHNDKAKAIGQRENFWLDIENDFMFFLGAEDRVCAMKLALEDSKMYYERKINEMFK